MKLQNRELLAVGVFGRGSRVGNRIETLLQGGRTFSPRASLARVAASTAALAGLVIAASFAPRWIALAQEQPTPRFEVASIREGGASRIGGEGRRREQIDPEPTRLIMRNVSLSSCLQWAYGVKPYQISGPISLTKDRYDIAATTGSPVAEGELRKMLQQLLSERFRIAFHRENRVKPVYVLKAGRTGPKLRPAQDGNDKGASYAAPGFQVVDGAFVFEGTSMPELADRLSDLMNVGRPVIDESGIHGVFDIAIKLAASNVELKRGMLNQDGLSIFTALEEQLGLKLVAARRPVDILVIDHVERPSAN
jgi:uncharacterized protein (TIGR03435 family)